MGTSLVEGRSVPDRSRGAGRGRGGRVDAGIVYGTDALQSRCRHRARSRSRHRALGGSDRRAERSGGAPLSRIPEERTGAGHVRQARFPQSDEVETWAIARFTVTMALLATALVLPPAIAVGWVLARSDFRGKTLLETIVSLPLVLPPVASGLMLLWLFGRRSPVGQLLDTFGIQVIFTWKAVVVAMMVISFPLVARSVRAGIEQVDRRYEQIGATLGAGPFRIVRTITLPLASRGIIAGAILGFSRALGEFGATIMWPAPFPGKRKHWRSASTRWSRPAAKTRRGAC